MAEKRFGIGASIAIGVGLLFVSLVATVLYISSRPLVRSLVTEVAAVAGACKVGVQEAGEMKKAFPANATEAGCDTLQSAYTSGVKVTPGRIQVAIKNVHRDVDGKTFTLQAMEDEHSERRATSPANIRAWRCSTNADPGAYKYFPANCRQPD